MFPMRFPAESVRFEFKSISMVKHRCSFMNGVSTLDLLKFSLPKVRDDPFGYLSPRIASDFADWSDLLGVSPDFPAITPLKSRDESLLFHLASSVLDLADFLQISSLSPDCFDITTVSMVFTHKIERCTSQTSLYVWSSSISGFVTSIASFDVLLVNGKLFGEIPWLNLKIEIMDIYGSLPRPPDVRSIVVCLCFLILLSRLASSTLDVVDCDVLWRYLANSNALSEGELGLEGFKLFLELGIDGYMPLKLLICEVLIKILIASQGLKVLDHICDMLNGLCTTKVLAHILKYCDAKVVQTSFEKAACVGDSQDIHRSQLVVGFFTIVRQGDGDHSNFGQIVLVVGSLGISNTKSGIEEKGDMDHFHEWMFSMFGPITTNVSFGESRIPRPSHLAKAQLDFYGRFGTLKDIIYGSLPRPPEDFGNLCFKLPSFS